MFGWHHQFFVHEFEQALEVGDGQGRLACCNPWGGKKSNMTEQLKSKPNILIVSRTTGWIHTSQGVVGDNLTKCFGGITHIPGFWHEMILSGYF